MGRGKKKNSPGAGYGASSRTPLSGVSFNAVAHGGEREGLKTYMRNRQWKEHIWVCLALAAIGVAVFVGLLGSSARHMESSNAPMFVSLPSSKSNIYGSHNALHHHHIRLRDVIFPPLSRNGSTSWLVICQSRPSAGIPASSPSFYETQPDDKYEIYPPFTNAAFRLNGMGAAIAMPDEQKSHIMRNAAMYEDQRRIAAWEEHHRKPLHKVLQTLISSVSSLLGLGFGRREEKHHAEGEVNLESFRDIWYEEGTSSRPTSRDRFAEDGLPVTLSMAVVDCEEKRYTPRMFQAPGQKQDSIHIPEASGTEVRLWSLSMGLGLQSHDDSAPVAFVTSHSRKLVQLTPTEVKTSRSMLRAASRYTNYLGKLFSIKDNDSLHAKCLDSSTADLCVLVLRQGSLDQDDANTEALRGKSVRSTLRKVLMRYRHLNWAQIDLSKRDLQPLPGDSRSGKIIEKWPRLALVRRIKEDVVTSKKWRKEKEGRKPKGKSKKLLKTKLVTRWEWYPYEKSMSDSDGISAFIERAITSNWSTLKPLPSSAKHRLRVVQHARGKNQRSMKAKHGKASRKARGRGRDKNKNK